MGRTFDYPVPTSAQQCRVWTTSITAAQGVGRRRRLIRDGRRIQPAPVMASNKKDSLSI